MGQLKAFVGHSFLDKDKEVVRSFLDYLDQIQEMNMDFSWEHAKPAEAKILSEKIKTLFEGKNLFIAICTKKELCIDQEKLGTSLLSKKHFFAKKTDFEWKPSDWIIQEIGFALGKGIDLILLLEEGVRVPGGLQGDFEYIPFSRSDLGVAFGKILETIKSLLAGAKPIVNPVTQEAPESDAEEFGIKTDKKQDPESEWSRDDYRQKLFYAIYSGDTEKEEGIYKKYLSTEDGKETREKDKWDATRVFFHIWLEKGGSISDLERISQRNPESTLILRYIAKAYQNMVKKRRQRSYF